MSENPAELFIELSLEGGDTGELDELTRQLRAEVEELNIDSVEEVSAGSAPKGTKSADFSAIGQMAVTLAPTIVAPLFNLLKSWVERKPSTPVKVKVRVGRKTTQIEYDPTHTSAKDLEALVKALNKSVKK
jgi:lysophospholipase L1-like esterase